MRNIPLHMQEHKPSYDHSKTPQGKRYCPDCEQTKDNIYFTSRTGKMYVYCQDCRNKKSREAYNHPDMRDYRQQLQRERSHQKNYGLTGEEYYALLARQRGVCAVCQQKETVIHPRSKRVQLLAVDHDHETGNIRGLLCSRCNHVLGLVKDNKVILGRMIDYL